MSKKSHNHRIFELDFLRGLALVMMCLDHLAYDLYCLPYWFSDADTVWIYRLGDFGEAVAFPNGGWCSIIFLPPSSCSWQGWARL